MEIISVIKIEESPETYEITLKINDKIVIEYGIRWSDCWHERDEIFRYKDWYVKMLEEKL